MRDGNTRRHKDHVGSLSLRSTRVPFKCFDMDKIRYSYKRLRRWRNRLAFRLWGVTEWCCQLWNSAIKAWLVSPSAPEQSSVASPICRATTRRELNVRSSVWMMPNCAVVCRHLVSVASSSHLAITLKAAGLGMREMSIRQQTRCSVLMLSLQKVKGRRDVIT